MSAPYRWTLGEYVLRCEQGADLSEVVVEGELDRDLIVDALRRWGAARTNVLDADYLHVSDAEVRSAGFPPGTKGRLLTVATALESAKRARDLAARVVVIVDRDYDISVSSGDLLLITDGHSLESYALSPPALDRFARLVLGRGVLPVGSEGESAGRRTTCTGDDLYRRVSGALIEIGAVRLTLQSLSSPLGLFDGWARYVSVAPDGMLTTNAQALVRNVLNHAGLGHEHHLAESRLRQETARVSADVFRLVRGHDFVSLLSKLLRSSWGRRIAGSHFATTNEASLARLLLVSVDPTQLDGTTLFAELRRRFAPARRLSRSS
jgi:hypothetical protein